MVSLGQISYVNFGEESSENVVSLAWSHDQDGHHAHIW